MKRQNRNVLLFVDNAPSHPNIQLLNIKVKFLLPNTHGPGNRSWHSAKVR